MTELTGGEVRRTWRYPSRYGEEKRVLADLKTLSPGCGIPADRAEDMASAVAEACLNAAEHGNGMNPERWVLVEFEYAGGEARCRVYDEGPGADEAKLAKRTAPANEGSERGWGILLMSELADRVEHFREERGFCTALTFKFRKEDGR
ncbi:ATP-binding protein [Paenibacillus antri]|uniref:ATP-binding protein n=1 Tax=Paenibacillus antri TaxID=2582848 RepID=A0A5R9G6Q8_9BACL|nr:ATP-binding protein [Paenibacillus antri]TLS52077.1 ATP-binding protein [Paenibacillus antri]